MPVRGTESPSTCSSNEYSFGTNTLTEGWTTHQELVSVNNPSKIMPSLYLGSKEDSAREKRLEELEITHILMVTSGNQHSVPGCKLLAVPMSDTGRSELNDIMRKTFDFMEEGQRTGNKLLVHCMDGHNRSPTLVIAWLMCSRNMSLYKAYAFVKEKRKVIHPHKLYIQQLREIEKQLHGHWSVLPDFLTRYLSDGELVVAHDNWNEDKCREYINLQHTCGNLLDKKLEQQGEEGELSKNDECVLFNSCVSSSVDKNYLVSRETRERYDVSITLCVNDYDSSRETSRQINLSTMSSTTQYDEKLRFSLANI